MPRNPAKSDTLELGYVSGVFGVRGEVRLFLHNRESDFFGQARAVTLVSPSGEERDAELKTRPGAGRRVIGRLTGIADRTAVEALIGWRIRVAVDSLPQPDDDEFYVHQILGAQVFVEDRAVGTVKTVHDSGPHTVFEVSMDAGGVGYVPAIESHLLELDVENKRLVVAPGALAVEE